MPIYQVKCSVCGGLSEIYRSISDYNDTPMCCGSKTDRVISASNVMPDIEPYKSMITGEMITSRSRHRDHLKQHGCIEIGNETKYLKGKPSIDLSKESKARRKEEIIRAFDTAKRNSHG